MKIRLTDKVQKIGDWETVFVVVAIQRVEPRYQIQIGDDPRTKEWVVTEDLEFLSR
jgi:hypothetical protein